MVTICGQIYRSPCTKCKTGFSCSVCALQKYKKEWESELAQRRSAEFKIETELVPRIKAERSSYDRWATTDKSAEWCDSFDYQVDQLLNMFDEDFISQLDFDGDDIASKIARLIIEEKERKS